ncbi:hypothetical protein DL770_006730 [Monosporascus sp. CRB-9-2]|nr:hypothetical protein DL770_006730 [Monosporascus sp. CRB-9-2]
MYCRRARECYPDELPMGYNVTQKDYSRKTGLEVPMSDEGEDEFEGVWEDVERSDNTDHDSEMTSWIMT